MLALLLGGMAVSCGFITLVSALVSTSNLSLLGIPRPALTDCSCHDRPELLKADISSVAGQVRGPDYRIVPMSFESLSD